MGSEVTLLFFLRDDPLPLHFNTTRAVNDLASTVGAKRRSKMDISSSYFDWHTRPVEWASADTEGVHGFCWIVLGCWLERCPTSKFNQRRDLIPEEDELT